MAAALIDAVGSGLVIPVAVLYFTLHVGLRPAAVGLGLTIAGVIAIAFGPLSGVVIEHFGPKRAVVGAWALAAVSYTGFAFVTSVAAMVAVLIAERIAGSTSGTARLTLLAEVAGQGEVPRLLAAQRTLRNLGYGVGGLLATADLAAGGTGFEIVIFGNVVSYLVAIGLVSRLVVARSERVSEAASPLAGLALVSRDRRYLALTVLNGLVSFHQTALTVALPLWVVLYTNAPRAVVGILFTVNTVAVVLAQIPISGRVRGLADLPRAYVWAGLSMVLSAAAFISSHWLGAVPAVGILVLAVLLLTATEMFSSAGEWVASFELADPAHRGAYLSIFGMGWSLGDAIGPVIGTAVITAGIAVGWRGDRRDRDRRRHVDRCGRPPTAH